MKARSILALPCLAFLLAATGCGSSSSNSPTCNALPADGPAVAAMISTATPPVPSGGTPTDGTYNLSALTLYTTAPVTAPTSTISAVFQIKGNTVQAVEVIDGQEKHYTSTFTASATSFTISDSCPAPTAAQSYPYTATSTQLRIFSTTTAGFVEQTYTKR
jgi:hypothetical protein